MFLPPMTASAGTTILTPTRLNQGTASLGLRLPIPAPGWFASREEWRWQRRTMIFTCSKPAWFSLWNKAWSSNGHNAFMITGVASATARSSSGRTAIFGIVCGAHFINHFQSAMLGVIYPLMMKELGMGYMALASLAAVYNTLGSAFQGLYGFVVP